jgi:hypothetical protein
MKSSPQLEEVFDFINAAPELRTTLISSRKNVVYVEVFGL